MSACSAGCDSFMNTAKVVCIDHRLTSPSRTPDAPTSEIAIRDVDELDALIRLHRQHLAMDGKAPRRQRPGPAGRAFGDIRGGTLGHRVSSCLRSRQHLQTLHLNGKIEKVPKGRGPRCQGARGAKVPECQGAACYTRRTTDARTCGSHPPVLPGDRAKWVKVPRGAATVSGELHPSAGSAGSHCEGSSFVGRRGCTQDPQARILTPGPSFSASHEASARSTPRRSSLRSRSTFPFPRGDFPLHFNSRVRGPDLGPRGRP